MVGVGLPLALMTASSRVRDSPVCKSTSESGVPHVVKIDLCTATHPVDYLEVLFFRSRSAHVVVPRSTLTHLQRSMRCRSSTERASPATLVVDDRAFLSSSRITTYDSCVVRNARPSKLDEVVKAGSSVAAMSVIDNRTLGIIWPVILLSSLSSRSAL